MKAVPRYSQQLTPTGLLMGDDYANYGVEECRQAVQALKSSA